MPAPLILVAEDEPAIRETLCDELSAAGYRTVSAADGGDALLRFESDAPDLVLTDLAMPGMSGWVPFPPGAGNHRPLTGAS